MAGEVERGDIWMYEFRQPDKRRPVLVLSRPAALALLDSVIVAPITTTVRGLPSEVLLGDKDGLKHASAASLDNVQTVRKAGLKRYVGHADDRTMALVCRALAVATGCS